MYKKVETFIEFGQRFYRGLSKKDCKGFQKDFFCDFFFIISGRHKNVTHLKRIHACILYQVAQLRMQLFSVEQALTSMEKIDSEYAFWLGEIFC